MKQLIFLATVFISSQLHAAGSWTKGFVKVRANQRLYVEYRKAAAGRPTVWFLNGLTWSTEEWQPTVAALDAIDTSIGIVLYDPEGMGKTLLDKAPITFDIPFDSQVTDLKDLHDTLNIQGANVLAGLSYGGGMAIEYLAKYPADFAKIVAIAPYLAPLPNQDSWIKQQIAIVRATQPLNPSTDDELYDYFLRQLVYTTYPELEPIMLKNPYTFEAVFRMVKGARYFNANDYTSALPAGKFHLVASDQDQYVPLASLQTYWQQLPSKDRASFINVADTFHELPTEHPAFMAGWLMEILNDNASTNQGLTFDGDPLGDSATSGSTHLNLP
jgi:pimeloyl-ACP methyl ester carboxylesterase